MDIEDLKYFIAIANLENITLAAEALYITPQYLRKKVKEMETELGEILFIRTKRKLRLTEFGEFFKKQADTVVEDFNKLQNLSETYKYLKEKTLRIGIGIIETSVMQKIYDDCRVFQRVYPEYKLEFVHQGLIPNEQSLRDGDIEVGLVVKPFEDPDFETITVVKKKYVLAMNKRHPLAKKSAISPEDIVGEQFVISSKYGDFNKYLIGLMGQDVADKNIVYVNRSTELWRSIFENNFAITISSAGTNIEKILKDIVVVPFDPPQICEMVLAYKKQEPQKEVLKTFIDYMSKNTSIDI